MRCQTLWQAKWILAVLVALTAAAWQWTPWLGILGAGLILFTLYFFRDPRRSIPQGAGLYVSPADGRVTDILEMEESEVTGKKMRRIGIFLSVFDVHVNRYPVDGVVQHVVHKAGKFLNAVTEASSAENEQASVGIVSGPHRILMRQIAGLIARRIITDSAVGDTAAQGARMGLIRFGSRVDVFLPPTSTLHVAVGQRTQAGVTVIAHLPTA